MDPPALLPYILCRDKENGRERERGGGREKQREKQRESAAREREK